MTTTTPSRASDELLREAMRLPESQRIALASSILETVKPAPAPAPAPAARAATDDTPITWEGVQSFLSAED